MSFHPGPIYEVTLSVDREIIESFDLWLAEHVRDMLAIDGFVDATVFETEDDAGDRLQRVTHYQVESEQKLQEYFDGPAAAMRQDGVERFGDQFSASRRILTGAESAVEEAGSPEHCLNCGESLAGQYCGGCGQRARSRLISLWELISDAFGDLFELDSRLWRTLVPLLVRPGTLTRDYLQGKRARFMPPFRMYIVLSLLFFVVLLFNPREEFGLFFEPQVPEAVEPEAEESASVSEIGDEIMAELEAEGIIQSPTEAVNEAAGDDANNDDDIGLSISTDGDIEDCFEANTGDWEMPPWMEKRLTPERLHAACERLTADDGKALAGKVADNIPTALFLLLPLMALVLKVLYPLSRRYYVEHLLFVVHFHAFFFLALTIQLTLGRMGTVIPIPDAIFTILIVAMSLYIPIYLYKSMRKVYEQGHMATTVKFVALTTAYFMGLMIIFMITGLLAIFSQ